MSNETQDVQETTIVADTVKCKRFVIENAEGGVGVEIGPNADGFIETVHYDTQGRRRLVFGVYQDGQPAIAILDQNDVPRIMLHVGPRSASIRIRDLANEVRANIGVSYEGDAAMFLLNREGRPAVAMDCTDSVPQIKGFCLDETTAFWLLPPSQEETLADTEPAADLPALWRHITLYNAALCDLEHNAATLRLFALMPYQGDAEFVEYDRAKREETLARFNVSASLATTLRGMIVASPCFVPGNWLDAGPTSAQAMLDELGLDAFHFLKQAAPAAA